MSFYLPLLNKRVYNVSMVNKHTYISFTKEEVDHIRQFISLHGDWQDKIINHLDDIFAYIDFPEDHILTIEAYGACIKEPKQEQVQRSKITH